MKIAGPALCVALIVSGCVEMPTQWTTAPNGPVAAPAPMGQPADVSRGGGTPPTFQAPPVLPVITDGDIRDVYVDLLGREPSRDEVREWRRRSREVPVTGDAIAASLRESREFRTLAPETVIRRAYWDFRHVEPGESEMRFYRRKFIDEHWSAGRVRRAIAEREVQPRPKPQPQGPSREPNREREEHGRDERRPDNGGFRGGNSDSPEAIVRRAYDDLLERKPDPSGLDAYVRVLRQGASEEDIRRRIKQSEEYRVSLPDSKTRRAYREVLGRDADEGGLQHYRKLIVDKGWTEDDVKNDLRKSAEYRNRKK